MFLRGYRRSTQRRYLRAVLLLAVVVFLLDLLSLLNAYKAFQTNLTSIYYETVPELPSHLRDQKIYIAATHWNSAEVLRSHWNAAVLDLVNTLGPENVYVSIIESGSWDDSKAALRELDIALGELNVPRTVILDPTTHADEIRKGPPLIQNGGGWIHTPRSGAGKEMRRIPYLARLRNLTLKPFWSVNNEYHQSTNTTFDKILFLNDVVFKTSDALTLLVTHGGSYSAACALDFKTAPVYYDTFALRDRNGDPTVSMTFPYFRDAASRKGMLLGMATEVQSCWNGMVLMDAGAFYASSGSGSVSFRGIDDSLAEEHLEGSECCLIHADVARLGSGARGVWVNPAVRVGYSGKAYQDVHLHGPAVSIATWDYLRGSWLSRAGRWTSTEWFRRRTVRTRLQNWVRKGTEKGEDKVEAGEMCLINEMQVLVDNGWKHL